jgi:DNA-binding HxlR family transcriptional regulator
MTESTKITFVARRVGDIDDVTDLVAILFPGNANQQHAAARILLMLKAADAPVASFGGLERQYGISRRTLQRTRAKLARLGLIEYASALSSRYGGKQGWRLSSRMSTAVRQLADGVDRWRGDMRPERMGKDERLTGLLR